MKFQKKKQWILVKGIDFSCLTILVPDARISFDSTIHGIFSISQDIKQMLAIKELQK